MPDDVGRNRARGVAERVGLLMLALFVGLGMAEGGLRLLRVGPEPALSTVSEAEFQRFPGIFAPNQHVRKQSGELFQHHVTVDSLGYRGRHVARAKPPGEFRVLFVGDSFTWGHNVEDDETLPAQVEALLVDLRGPARVINAGLSGSTILGQDEMVARGLALDPDLVILMYHENDIDELAHVRVWEQLAHNRRIKSRFPLSLAYRLARHTAVGHLALHARVAYQSRGQTAERGPVVADSDWLEATRQNYRERLHALSGMLAGRGIPLLFVTFPHPTSLATAEGGRDYDWVVQTARDLGLPVVDILRIFMADDVPVQAAYLVPHDYHPSPQGHAWAAVPIYEWIARTLPPHPSEGR